jgi:hypothetical protein
MFATPKSPLDNPFKIIHYTLFSIKIPLSTMALQAYVN